jgi:multidrug resistance efflux pump
LKHLLWVPFQDAHDAVHGGMVLARATPWSESDVTVATYLASAFAPSWLVHGKPRRGLWLDRLISLRTGLIAAVLIVVVGALPVPMTALAPVEVVAKDPFVVTAGISGVVQDVLVKPSTRVGKTQPLLRLDTTLLQNQLDVAARQVAVSQARYKQAAQRAVSDSRGRHDLAVTQAERAVKVAEKNYAETQLARATVRAPVAGLVIFSDARDLIGKPVSAGEKLMEIADPKHSEFRIDLPVSESLVLHPGARVKVFLDSDPLHPLEASVARFDYRARMADNQSLAFRAVARAKEEIAPASVRLGVRGTAQLYGDDTTLAFYLFRRPLTAVRQWFGL